MKTLTDEQRQATVARRDRFRALVRQVGKMTAEERDTLGRKLVGLVTCEGHALSLSNTLLIALQSNGHVPTLVGGFRQWRKHGRQIRKGEHGLMIWIPKVGTIRNEADPEGTMKEAPRNEAEAEIRFFPGTVFDIAQTEEVA